MPDTNMLDWLGRWLLFYGLTALVAGGAAYLGSYLRKKGENFATHEDVDKLI